jgi:hypothetical protein
MPNRPTHYHTKPPSPQLTPNWFVGPRTPAWDSLWRRIVHEAIGPAIAAHRDDHDDPACQQPPERLP